MQTLNQQYAATFDFLELEQQSVLQPHIDRLKSLENILPFGMTFMFITNPTTQQYLYFTDNVEHCTGMTKQELYEGGVPYVINRVHPDDRELWTLAVETMMPKLFALPPEQQLRANFQFNYRFQHLDGSYLNIVDNSIPIELTDDDLPYLFFGQANVTGKNETLPVGMSLSILNDEGQYEELYRMNLSEEMFRNHFTKRENEILGLMTNGLTSKAIAEQLFISVDTVKTHRKRINAKLKQLEFRKEDLQIS